MTAIPTKIEKQMEKVGIKAFVVINKRGRIVDSFGENGLNISKEKKEVLFMSTVLQCSMQDEQNDDFGRMQFCITKRDKSKFFCQHVGGDRIAIIVANNRTDDSAIVDYVNQISKMYTLDTISEKDVML